MTSKKLQVTELDFNDIKQNLISYLKELRDDNGNAIYTDYDFKGSALNTLLDVFAYNTHYNALTAHFAVNESFITSAQIRSNVVSAAKSLGYLPRSSQSASMPVIIRFPVNENVSLNSVPETIFVFDNVGFRALVDGFPITWNLQTGVTLSLDKQNKRYVNIDEDNNEIPVILVEGKRRIVRYSANPSDVSQKYVIDDDNIDINSLIVRVYPNAASTTNIPTYTRFTRATVTDGNSTIYFIDENNNGKYEISFGNGSFGKKLEPGNIIEIEYISTIGFEGNGLSSPVKSTNISGIINNYVSSPEIIIVSPSSGGSDREATESIRETATRSFITQNRAVTADDYKSIILTEFPGAESISVWGGEDNIPPVYGKVFIAVNKKTDNPNTSLEESLLNDTEKEFLLNELRGKKILSITPEIIDPEYINLVLDVLFKYDSASSRFTKTQIENEIRENVVRKYNTEELNSFDKVFRHSNLIALIDGYDPSILNSHVRVFVSKTFLINPTSSGRNIIKYGTDLAIRNDRVIVSYQTYPAVDEDGILTSGVWTLNGLNIFIKDRATRDRNIREIYTYTIDTEGNEIIISPNVGIINLNEGILEIDNLQLADEPINISVDLIPRSNDIVSRRNQLIRINVERCNVQGSADIIAVGGSSQAVRYTTFSRDR